jgi:hypothetical protein
MAPPGLLPVMRIRFGPGRHKPHRLLRPEDRPGRDEPVTGDIIMFKKIVLWGAVLIIVALAGMYFYRNILVEKAVESGSTYALGVDTNLGSARLAFGGGSIQLNDLAVDNPPGFAADDFLTLRRGLFDVDAGSILDKEVVVDSFVIEGVTLNLEQVDGKGNYQVLLDNIRKLDMSSSGESRKFRFDLIALRDITVTGALSLLGKKNEKSFTLDNFTLRNVGGDHGATIGQVTATVVKALISKALSSGSGLLPDGLGKNLSDLKNQGLDNVKTEGLDKLKDLGKSLTGEK